MGQVSSSARSFITKDVRMTANQLAIELVKNFSNRKVALVGRHLGVKEDLQEQIAEFFR